jgi:hypothetical protein
VSKGKRKAEAVTPRPPQSIAKPLAVLRVLRSAAITPEFVRGSLLNTTSFGQLRKEGTYHPFAEALAAVGLQPLLITCIDVHHIQIATYVVERIGGVLFGVATDLLTLELDLDA